MAKRTGLRRPERKRLGSVWLWLVLLSVLLVLGWTLLQEWEADRWLGGVQGDDARHGDGGTVRGAIYDRNYKELAVSLERVSVYARTREIGNPESVAGKLSPILEVEVEQLQEMLSEGSQRIWLVKDISQEQEDAIREENLPGIYLHRDYSRFYPQKTVAAHVVGFAEDGIGLAGIEYYYDRLDREVLAGEDEYQGRGDQELVLTLDMKIQGLLEDLVLKLSEERSAARIAAYVMDSSSGALVGAAQHPTFNPNTYRLYTQDALESLLVQPMVVPTRFRLLFREAAMLKSQYDTRGTVLPWSASVSGQSLGTELRLWESLGLESSPSDEFVIVTGSQRISGYTTILDVQGQNLGTVPEMMSPLNLMSGLSGILNGGEVVTPHVASMIVDGRGGKEFSVRREGESGAGREVVTEEVSREFSYLFGGLATQDEYGANLLDDEVTYLAVSGDSWELGRNTLCFAALPLHKTEVVVLVTIQEQGTRLSRGRKKVEPKKALAAILPRIAVLQQVGKGLTDVVEPAEGEDGNFPATLDSIRRALKGSTAIQGERMFDTELMPDVVGLSLRKALRALQDTNCRIRIFGTGEVKSQQPAPGTKLTGEAECVLKLRQEEVSVQNFEKKVVN